MQELKPPLHISKAQLALMQIDARLRETMDITYVLPSDVGKSGGLPQVAKEYLAQYKEHPLLDLCYINPLNQETWTHGPPAPYMSSQYGIEPATILDHHLSTFWAYPILERTRDKTNLNIDKTMGIALSHDMGADFFKHLFDRTQFLYYGTDHEDNWLNIMRTEPAEQILHKVGLDQRNIIHKWKRREPEFLTAQIIERAGRMLGDGPILTPTWFTSSERNRVSQDGSISVDKDGNISLTGDIIGFEFEDWYTARMVKLGLQTLADYAQIKEAETFMRTGDPRRGADVLRKMVYDELINNLPPDEVKRFFAASDLAFTRGVQEIIRKYATTKSKNLRASKEWVNYCRSPRSVVFPQCMYSFTYASSEEQLPVPSLQRIGEAEAAVREITKNEIKVETSQKFDLYLHKLLLYCLKPKPLHLASGGFFALNDDSKKIKLRFGGEEGWRAKGVFEYSRLISTSIKDIDGFRSIVAQHEADIERLKAGGHWYDTKKWPEIEISEMQKELLELPTPDELWARSRNGINGR
jgi:hypothetical protein